MRADDRWSAGAHGRRRITHLAVTASGGALYIASETVLKDDLAPLQCSVCSVPGFDEAVRNALVWNRTDAASTISNVTGFVLAPTFGLGAIAVASSMRGWDTGHWIDDTLPILEASIAASLINQTVKFAVGRQRPFVHFADPARPADVDDNLSFFSGHTTLAFAITTSAGMVAHARNYSIEPVVWAGGYALAATTGYLRIAADKHYASDVVVGAIVGTGVGLATPLLLHGHLGNERVSVVPLGNSVRIVGQF